MSITVLNPGLLTSIQDLGRTGFQKYGIIVGGAMDLFSLRLANILVGNREGEAALEITMLGPSLKIQKGTVFSITGANISPTIEGKDVPMYKPVYLNKDIMLKFGVCKSGCRAYLAFAGGFKVNKIMESKSTYIRAEIGGYKGRALKKDDILELENPGGKSIDIINKLSDNEFTAPNWCIRGIEKEKFEVSIIRVIRERQFENFSEQSLSDFFHSSFTISMKSDRMGYRLSGNKLKLKEPLEMISEPVYFGTIQVPPDGNPIVLLADRQSVGGYPKIAQIASVDIQKIAQLKPNEKIMFKEISLKEAERLYFEREKYIKDIKIGIDFKW